MRKVTFILLIVFSALLACSNSDPETTKPKTDPETPVVDPNQGQEGLSDTPPLVRGFMVSSLSSTDKNTLQTVKSWGANVIRLQLNPMNYAVKQMGSTYEKQINSYISMLKQRLAEAKAVGLKVVVDLHEAPRLVDGEIPTGDNTATAEFWKDPTTKPAFVTFWDRVANELKDHFYNDVVWGYDLFNEPSIGWTRIPPEWKGIATECVNAIRKYDQDVWIVYEPVVEINAFPQVTPLDDKRVVYSVHFYRPHGFTHQGVLDGIYASKDMTREEALSKLNIKYPGQVPNIYSHAIETWDKDALIKAMKPFDDFIEKYKVPALIGEFSVVCWVPTDCAVAWLKDVIEMCEQRHYSWCYHAFREWQGWSLEHPEGVDAFWFSRDKAPEMSPTETRRAALIKAALKKNQQ